MIRALVTAIFVSFSLCILLAAKAQAHPSWGIVVDRQGQVYFSDLKTIWKIDAQGRLSVFRTLKDHTHELNIDEAGNLYGAENSYDPATQRFFIAIWKMTPSGGFSYLLAPTDNPPRGISIWRDRNGNTYSVEQNNHLKRETLLLRRTPSGSVSVLAGGSYGHADGKGSQAKFRSIVGMAFGPDGSLYLADDSSVRKVTMDGTVTTLAGDLDVKSPNRNPVEGEIAWGNLMGLTVNAQGDVYVADYRSRRVLKIASNGAISTVSQSEQTWTPTAVALAGNGDLYILEFGFTSTGTNAPRVRKLSSDGRNTVLASVGEKVNPSVGESEPGQTSERSPGTKPSMPYVLLGLG
ncbi:MAG: hypothetical protein LC785_05580, partial [Acidobacteria bacterium]|nr:hypothetical protein [Acidobacteriota bacterium]